MNFKESGDKSLELKRGQIKTILVENFEKNLIEFEFLAYKNKTYFFQRLRHLGNFPVYEIIYVLFSMKDKIFDCGISSRLDKSFLFSSSYDSGLLNPHYNLIVLKTGKNAHPLHEAYYFHDGLVDNTTKVVQQISVDFLKFGIPFLDKQILNLSENKIIGLGLDYITKLQTDKKELFENIDSLLAQDGYNISSIKHPIYEELKKMLQSIPNQKREDRIKIPKLTLDLLQLYWTN